jgi:hypothetical protein
MIAVGNLRWRVWVVLALLWSVVLWSASGGVPTIDYLTFAVVVAVPVAGVAIWLGRRYLSVHVAFTDDTAEPEVESDGPWIIATGKGSTEVWVRVRPRASIEIGRVDLRLQQDEWDWKWSWQHGLQRIYRPSPASIVRLTGVRDGNRETFERGDGTGEYPRQLTTSFNRRDRSLLIAEYSPAWQVGAGVAVILVATVQADEQWEGFLTLSLPNAVRGRAWKRLRLTTSPATGRSARRRRPKWLGVASDHYSYSCGSPADSWPRLSRQRLPDRTCRHRWVLVPLFGRLGGSRIDLEERADHGFGVINGDN